jgi:hypothetical protein
MAVHRSAEIRGPSRDQLNSQHFVRIEVGARRTHNARWLRAGYLARQLELLSEQVEIAIRYRDDLRRQLEDVDATRAPAQACVAGLAAEEDSRRAASGRTPDAPGCGTISASRANSGNRSTSVFSLSTS